MAALRVVALASANNPDPALLALGAELAAADQLWEACYQKQRDVEEACFAAIPPEPEKPVADVLELWTAGGTNDPVPFLAHKKAWDRYRSAINARREAMEQAELNSGLAPAAAAANAATDARLAILAEKLIPTRARTLAGLIFKAQYAASHFPDDPDEDVLKSIMHDLLAMAGETV
jgi:hypothetical protein